MDHKLLANDAVALTGHLRDETSPISYDQIARLRRFLTDGTISCPTRTVEDWVTSLRDTGGMTVELPRDADEFGTLHNCYKAAQGSASRKVGVDGHSQGDWYSLFGDAETVIARTTADAFTGGPSASWFPQMFTGPATEKSTDDQPDQELFTEKDIGDARRLIVDALRGTFGEEIKKEWVQKGLETLGAGLGAWVTQDDKSSRPNG